MRTAVWIIIIIALGALAILALKQHFEEPLEEPQPAADVQAPQQPQQEAPAPATTTPRMNIETTTEGTGPGIAAGQTAVVQYEGRLENGTVFDSTASRNNTPFEFTLGENRVIQGWEQGILGMKVGETRVLTIPPELGYGAQGYPPVIPQNATLVFTVTLEAIK